MLPFPACIETAISRLNSVFLHRDRPVYLNQQVVREYRCCSLPRGVFGKGHMHYKQRRRSWFAAKESSESYRSWCTLHLYVCSVSERIREWQNEE